MSKNETYKERTKRKHAEYQMAVIRTACNLLGTLMAIVGFLLTVYIALKVGITK